MFSSGLGGVWPCVWSKGRKRSRSKKGVMLGRSSQQCHTMAVTVLYRVGVGANKGVSLIGSSQNSRLKLIVHRYPYLTFCNTTNWLNICTSFNLVSVLHQSILTILLSNLSEHQFLFIFGLGNALSSTLFSNQLKLIFFFLSQTPMNPGNLAPVVTRTSKNMAEAARVSGGLIDFLTRVLY